MAASYKVTLIPGDGVGPEVVEATRRVLEATGVHFEWDKVNIGAEAEKATGKVMPDNALESVRATRVALKGPVTTPIGYGFRSVNVALRKELDLYACVRPCRIYPGAPTSYKDVDIVIVRENTEDLYAGIEFKLNSPEALMFVDFVRGTIREQLKYDSGFTIKAISESGTRRIVKYAFDYARAHGRKKVTAVHKANIMKYTDGLFQSLAREVAAGYNDIQFEDMLVDAISMRLVMRPQQFDVIVTPNFYGDFLSELCAGLIGGLGFAPGANIGENVAVFEATHGSAPKHAGKNRINPMAMMLSGVMLLRHIGENQQADRVEGAIAAVVREGKTVTYDLKNDPEDPGAAGTSQVADAVIARMKG
jgi:isocitrate dehydrogenase (NAD+)